MNQKRNPRINLSVPEDLYGVIKRLADASDTPITHVVMELLEGARPVLEINAAVAETTAKMKPAEKLQMRRVMDALEYKYADRQLSTEDVLKVMLEVARGDTDENQLDIEEYLRMADEDTAA